MSNRLKTIVFAIIVFISGVAGLSYELLWIRSIKGFFGNELFSISMVITLYFAGLGIGGFVGNKVLKRGLPAIKVYVVIEILIGIFGLLFPTLIRLTQGAYLASTAILPEEMWIVVKSLYITLLFIVPTTLIGMTLPVITAIVVEKAETFTSRFSLFYGINTVGAVAGCLMVGFILIPEYGIVTTGRLIVICNVLVALLCFIFRQDYQTDVKVVYKFQKWDEALKPSIIAFLMGFLALTYEIVWFRIFNFYFLSTTVSLALLLSMFLIGLALGSIILSFWRRPVNVRQLAFIELGKGIMMVVSFFVIREIFYHGWAERLAALGEENVYQKIVGYYLTFGLIAFMLPGLLMGMTFPLIERIWPSSKAGTSHVVGVISAWNTWGGALGSLLTGLLFIAWMGTINTLIMSIVISALLAGYIFFMARKPLFSILPLLLAIFVFIFLPREMNWKRGLTDARNYEYYEEGKMASISIIKNRFGDMTLNMDNGYVLGGTGIMANIVQHHQGALPTILNIKKQKKALKIGEGTGITSNAIAKSTDVSQLDIVEIVPEVVGTLPYFSYFNEDLVNNRKVKLFKGDGREFMALSNERYDIIIGELYSPQIAGVANLYSIEHFKNIKEHLEEDGVFCQWLQLAQFSEETFLVVVNTFLQVFPNATLWMANNSVTQPAVGIIYSKDGNYQPEKIRNGLMEYADDFKASIGWESPEDIAVAFITDDLSKMVSNESRINTLDKPIIEEIAARTLHIEAPVDVLIQNKKWPDQWKEWHEGYKAWSAYWDLFTAYQRWNSERSNKNLNMIRYYMNALPESGILDIYEAELLVEMMEISTSGHQFKNDTEMASFKKSLYTQAIAINPDNWAYYFNACVAYAMLGQEDRFNETYVEMWKLLPEPLKEEPIFQELLNQEF